MATGRADFWYGRPFLLTDTPDEFNTQDAPTANWAYNHAVNVSAHHVRYSDAEAVAAMGVTGNLNTLRHNRYNDGEAQAAMGVKANYNPFNHDRYADSEAVTAMGAKADANPLNHDRYTDANAQAACWPTFIDRGDPANMDFATASFTKDWTWRDLDLSAIVPAGAKAVVVRVKGQSTVNWGSFYLRKNGNVNFAVTSGLVCVIANAPFHVHMTVAIDANRKIEYIAENVTWTTLDLVVMGWWK